MKRKSSVLLRAFVLAAFLPVLSLSLVSCEPDGDDSGSVSGVPPEVTVPDGYENAVLLGCDSCRVSFEVGSFDVELQANVDFEYEILASWVREQQPSARSMTSYSLTFEYEENAFCDSREAHIVFFNSEYAVGDTLTVVQSGNPEGYSVGVAVDLGLSVKWANCNVGANSPEEYGDYFAWGETEEKSDYSWETYKWCNGSDDTQTKYCTNSYYGNFDNKTVLDPEDDAATVNWGGSWRMPTRAEQDELRTECDWEWTTLNGVNGYEITGPNGNSIFLPATGRRYGTDILHRGSNGSYWSASLYARYSGSAYYLFFNDRSNYQAYLHRGYGFSVRPVTE